MSICNIPGAVLSPGGTKFIQIRLGEELTEMGGKSSLKRGFFWLCKDYDRNTLGRRSGV